jgi:hypothetical protein
VAEEPDFVPNIFDRLIAAGFSLERAGWCLGAGRVELDGDVETDGYRLGPRPARLIVDVP